MKQFSKEDWKKYAAMYVELEAFAEKYIKEFCYRDTTLIGIAIDGDYLTISTEIYFSGCGSEYDDYMLPLAWFSEPDSLMRRCKKKKEDAELAEKARKRELAEKKKEDNEAARRANYLKLKEEFGEQE